MGARSEKAEKQNLSYLCFVGGVYNVLCSLNMNALIGLFTNGTINFRTVSNRIASGKSFG